MNLSDRVTTQFLDDALTPKAVTGSYQHDVLRLEIGTRCINPDETLHIRIGRSLDGVLTLETELTPRTTPPAAADPKTIT